MIGTIAKTFAYTKAPRTTFFILHPKKAAKLRKLKYDIRHAYAPRVAAAGTLALALPLGFLIGRSTNGHGDSKEKARRERR